MINTEITQSLQIIKKAELFCTYRYRLGIGCDATNAEAVAKIYKLKQEPKA
jgi:hypothetical protein